MRRGYDPPDPAAAAARAHAEDCRAWPRLAIAVAFPRLDLPSKVDGSYLFAGDVRLPGMVYAAIRHGPIDQAELTGFDDAGRRAHAAGCGGGQGARWIAAVAELVGGRAGARRARARAGGPRAALTAARSTSGSTRR